MSVSALQAVTDTKQYGGKAANLGNLLRADLPVPPGFAIAVTGFNQDGRVKADQTTVVNKMLDPTKKYAVRSSAIMEDAAGASWAGQFESYLNVDAKEVLQQIEICHAAVKARADAYAAEQGEAEALAANVAVVVQEMVEAKFAGVMFTKNPSDGANQIIIEYIPGLGEALVHGDADPERIVWRRGRKNIKEQTEAEIPFDIKELMQLAEKVEQAFNGVPQDIEWAYDGQQFWLVQSRPITTLQERGSGKHYLGDPGDLFYWGPSRALPLYMGDFLSAESQRFLELASNPDLPDPPKTIVLFYAQQVVWLNKQKDFDRFVEDMFRWYEKTSNVEVDEAAFVEASVALDAYFNNNKTHDLVKVNELFEATWRPTLDPEMSLYGAEVVLHERLARFDEESRRQIWGSMTLPDEPTFFQQIDIKLAQTKNPQQLAEDYPWIEDGYSGVVGNALAYFTKRLPIVSDVVNLQTGSEQVRQAIIQQFKLTKAEVNALDMARKLSVFMDHRKAWMMRSRQYIASFAAQLSIPAGQLNQTTLKYLSQGRTKPFAGWSFLSGTPIALTREDAALAWDWYIEFRASNTVLSGLIASSGGRHFMNGEVFIAQSPTDSMPPNSVLVVPSTSPSYIPLMRHARALVTDHGGMMSHAAIVAREFGLPCIVGTKRATKILKTGDKVVLDLVKGEINK